MEYNPYSEHCKKTQQRIGDAETDIAERAANIEWYDQFKIAEVSAQLHTSRLQVKDLEQQVVAINAQMSPVQAEIARLNKLTPFTFNPMQWFNDERMENKRRLKQQRAQARQLQEKLVLHNVSLLDERRASASLDAEVDRFRRFERVGESATLAVCVEKLADLRRQLEQEYAKKTRIDAKLAEPLASLNGYLARDRILSREIDQAAELEATLDRASNGYERHLVHEQCKNLFGDGSPAKVMRQRQSQRESIRRSIDKLETRLSHISRAAARVIRTVVIDGNNLCYENHREVIGLGAIEAAVKSLSADYKVVIVFDAQICAVLRMKHSEIAARFRQWAQVHIVTSRSGADETILDAASDKDTYVISNDRFRDFADKPVVREGRVVIHSIVNRKIMISDFAINAQFVA